MTLLDFAKMFDACIITAGGKDAIISCPYDDCNGGPKLYLHLGFGCWHCFRCDRKGNLYKLVLLYNRAYQDSVQISDFSVYKDSALAVKMDRAKRKKVMEVSLPKGFKHVWEDAEGAKAARDYLSKRGLSDPVDWKVYEIGYTMEGKYSYSLVFPVKAGGVLVNWVTRDFTNKKKIKTLNGYKDIKEYLYNFDNAKKYKQIIITEGIIDAITMGFNTIAVFGKTISDSQVRKILASSVEEVYIALDGDTHYVERNNMARKLAGLVDVHIVDLPDTTDPNNLGKIGMLKLMEDSRSVVY